MNIDYNKINLTENTQINKTKNNIPNDSAVKFSDELKETVNTNDVQAQELENTDSKLPTEEIVNNNITAPKESKNNKEILALNNNYSEQIETENISQITKELKVAVDNNSKIIQEVNIENNKSEEELLGEQIEHNLENHSEEQQTKVENKQEEKTFKLKENIFSKKIKNDTLEIQTEDTKKPEITNDIEAQNNTKHDAIMQLEEEIHRQQTNKKVGSKITTKKEIKENLTTNDTTIDDIVTNTTIKENLDVIEPNILNNKKAEKNIIQNEIKNDINPTEQTIIEPEHLNNEKDIIDNVDTQKPIEQEKLINNEITDKKEFENVITKENTNTIIDTTIEEKPIIEKPVIDIKPTDKKKAITEEIIIVPENIDKKDIEDVIAQDNTNKPIVEEAIIKAEVVENKNINKENIQNITKNNLSNTEPSAKEEIVDIKPVENKKSKKTIENITPPVIKENKIETEEEVTPIEKVIDSDLATNDKKPKKIENKKIDNAIEVLSSLVKELNQSDDKSDKVFKKEDKTTDNKEVINNDFNIQENKDLLPQMTPNMNFSGDGQPFSSFMNNEETDKKQGGKLKATAQDLAEEAAILSTMAENIAIANKNQVKQPEVKVVTRQDGIKKVDTKTNITIETVVKYDSVIMNEADVEVFANLVENQEVNIKELAPKAAEKSVEVSKTLADMLAKAMEKNQPVRIDFDNNISVIIRISRNGKISADFLPSSQVAEAYLKENLPLLRQKFDDNNLDYDSLNQRERRDQSKENNRKKGRNNE